MTVHHSRVEFSGISGVYEIVLHVRSCLLNLI